MQKPVASQSAKDEAGDDDAVPIRYSLTVLGEAVVAERNRVRFRGFGPCAIAELGNSA